MDRFIRFPGASTVDRPLVVPTKLSKASFEYLKERRILTTDDFSLATVTRTIGKVGPENEMVWNQLSRMNAKGEYNVYDRLKFLKEMIEKHQKNLFP